MTGRESGTVRKNRSGMPSFGKLAKGQQVYQTTGELLALKWMDKREVHILTTLHKPVMVETEKNDRKTGRKITKPLYCTIQQKYESSGSSRYAKQFLGMSTENSEMVQEIVFPFI